MGTKEDLKAFRELQKRVKVVLQETEWGNTITRKFTKIRTAARQFGKPFAVLFQSRQVARASKTQIHLLMNSVTFLYLWENLSKAFDSIKCHGTLLFKLQGLGASSKASKWFEGYL